MTSSRVLDSTPFTAYLRRRLDAAGAEAEADGNGLQRAHALLLAATLEVPRAAVALRRPSLCHDGTPVVYSHECGDGGRQRCFRMLVEPGGTGILVPEQVDRSLHVLDELLGVLGWRAAAADLNAIIAEVFPRSAEAVDNWWGGIWLGLAAGPDALEVRLYLNLRHGSLETRWQRVAGVLGLFGDERLGPPLQQLADTTAPLAIPVGLGLVVTGGRVPVLRLYVGVHHPCMETLGVLLPDEGQPARTALAEVCAAFGSLDGAFGAQSVTVGYDFRRDAEGTILPSIARTKLDLSCQFHSPAAKAKVLGLTAGLAGGWGFDTAGLHAFARELTACFGGFDVDYLSLGLAGRPVGLTLYAKPHGWAGF